MDEKNDEKILRQMEASDADLRDLFQKYNTFLNGLSKTQRRLFLNSEVSLEQAAKTLQGVSQEELRAFLAKHTQPGGLFCSACGVRKHRELDDE